MALHGVDLSGAVPQLLQEPVPLTQQMMNIVPRIPVAALANGDMLAIIFFALIFGVATMVVGEKARPVPQLMDATSEVMLKFTGWVMEVAPLGVFALIALASGHGADHCLRHRRSLGSDGRRQGGREFERPEAVAGALTQKRRAKG